VLTIDRKNIHALHNRGISYEKIGAYRQSIRDFTSVLELDPQNANAYFNRGSAFDSLGDFENAIADYTKALELEQVVGKKQNQINNTQQYML
jgi:tetratricopeptide (TPR) repeat protein